MLNTTILFDIDGTLLLAGGVGSRAFDLTFLKMFNVESAWGSTRAHGKTDPGLIDELSTRVLGRLLSESELLTLKSQYITHFESSLQTATNFRLLPGVRETLEILQGMDNILLGIETGNFEETALLKLQWKDIASNFLFGGYASDSRDRSEIVRIAFERSTELAPDSCRKIVIGDSINDIQAAKENQAEVVLVLTGGIEANEAEGLGADLILNDLSQQADLLKFLA